MSNEFKVDVVVPVYGNYAAVKRCLDSVLIFRNAVGRLIVVDDASPDAATVDYLRLLEAQGAIELVRHKNNLGVVAAANTGVTTSTRDVILLNSDTEVHGDWAARLLRCAYSSDRIGTVTPFSNCGSVCSYPSILTKEAPKDLSLADLDTIFARTNSGELADLPSGTSFCMLIRRACLAEVGMFDVERFGRGYGEETDFCQRAALAGWRNVVCADTFIYHEGAGSFGQERHTRREAAEGVLANLYPDYQARVREFLLADSLRPFREKVDAVRMTLWPEQAAMIARDREAERAWLVEVARS